MSVCHTWWRVSMEASSLWENVHIVHKMPVSFLGLALNRAGGRGSAVHLQSRNYLRSGVRRPGYFTTIQSVADRIKNLTFHLTASHPSSESNYLPELFAIPYPNLKSLDLSYNAFYSSVEWGNEDIYRPRVDVEGGAIMLRLIGLIPTGQLSHLTLRHMRGWPPTRFGNLTNLTLFGYADGNALAEAVPANPALQKLKLESIKRAHRYSYDAERRVVLDGQTLELARCTPSVLSMFALSSTCSLIITKTAKPRLLPNKREFPKFWLPEDISAIRCLHDLEQVHFSITRIPGRKGWIVAEQKTIGYPTSNSTSGSGSKSSVTFTLTYHYDARTPLYEVPFESKYLLPHPIPWGGVIRASFDGFHDQFMIRDNLPKLLPNLRSLVLGRCESNNLLRFIMVGEVRGLESLRFEDELCGTDFGGTLFTVFEFRRILIGQRLNCLEFVTPGDPSSIITSKQMEKLKECVFRVEQKDQVTGL